MKKSCSGVSEPARVLHVISLTSPVILEELLKLQEDHEVPDRCEVNSGLNWISLVVFLNLRHLP